MFKQLFTAACDVWYGSCEQLPNLKLMLDQFIAGIMISKKGIHQEKREEEEEKKKRLIQHSEVTVCNLAQERKD